jgi:hypothetical protein
MRTALLTILALAVPRAVLACPVCFGQNDSSMIWGARAGVFFMLGLTVAVLAAFAAFFIYLMRRAKMFADTESLDESGDYVLRSTGPVLHATESRFLASDPAQRGAKRW